MFFVVVFFTLIKLTFLNMKNFYFTLLFLSLSMGFFSLQANAQAPQRMSYQSVIRNSSNVLLANTAVGIRISVLQGSATGTAVYVETQTATTNGNGLLSLQIGTGTATTGIFAGINWAAGPYFIKTETDPAGGSNYSITGTQEMLSVPYALYAETSGGQGGVTTAGSGIDVTGAGTVVSPYVVSATSPCGLAIGQTYQGGIIFYLDASGCHGLLSAPTDQSTSAPWANYDDYHTSAYGGGLFDGKYNTFIIMFGQGGTTIAAAICENLTLGGYSDWYLPSIGELDKMYENIGPGNALGLGNVGGFATGGFNPYWSSTERSVTYPSEPSFNNPLYKWFGTGGVGIAVTSSAYYVRAVRAF
jgi:hypothetical protein